jgi:hypothetical protein
MIYEQPTLFEGSYVKEKILIFILKFAKETVHEQI